MPRQGAWNGMGTRILHNLLSRVSCQVMDGRGQTDSTPLSRAPPRPEHRHLHPSFQPWLQWTPGPRRRSHWSLGWCWSSLWALGKLWQPPWACPETLPTLPSQPAVTPGTAQCPAPTPLRELPCSRDPDDYPADCGTHLWAPCSWLPPLMVALSSPPHCRRGLSFLAAVLPL